MASSIFNAGGGAGIGSYVIVFKDGILDPKTDFARLRGAYDSGDTIYLSLIGEGYGEALIPASGWVDENDELHLVARDFDDGETYTIDLALNAHEATVDVYDGIEIAGAKIPEGASVPEPQESDRGLYLKVSDQGELEYAEGGSGDGKITLDVETITRRSPALNTWYDLRLGTYSQSDFEEHKFILAYKGMFMEEVGVDYLDRMNVRPSVMPGEDGQTEAVFAFMGGDSIFIILFYRNAKGTLVPYGILQPSAAYAVGDVNAVTTGYMDYETGLRTQVGCAVLTNQGTIGNLIDDCGADDAAISVTTTGEGFAETGIATRNNDAETGENLTCQAFVAAASDQLDPEEEIEGPVHHSIALGTIFEGQKDGNGISGKAFVAVQAKWREGTEGERSADDSSVILRAPNIALQTANLTLQTLDPIGGALGEPSRLLFGKYNSIINGTSYSIKQASLSDIGSSLLPWNNAAYPALLLLDEGEMVELTNVSATEQSLSGEMYDVKTGFHFYFSIPAGGRGTFTPNSTTPLFKLLKPFSAEVADDSTYAHLSDTCVRPEGSSYQFHSDVQSLTDETVYIAKDFSKIRISGNADFPSYQEYTVYAKEIGIYNEVPYDGQFWFLVPDTNSSTGFVSHWVKIENGVE